MKIPLKNGIVSRISSTSTASPDSFFSMSKTSVFSTPSLASLRPISFGTSFSAMWTSHILSFTESGRDARPLTGVWIGGTPHSCRMRS